MFMVYGWRAMISRGKEAGRQELEARSTQILFAGKTGRSLPQRHEGHGDIRRIKDCFGT